jgi:hypothetical protein
MKRSLRVLAGAVAVSFAVLGGAVSASAQVPPPIDTGGGGEVDGAPGGAPAVTVFADCVVSSGKSVTAWFGYTNTFSQRVNLDVGPNNSTTVNSVAQANSGQVVQFQPGTVRRAFTMSHQVRGSATWSVQSPVFDGNNEIDTVQVTATDVGAPACPSGTPNRSAGVQTTGDSANFEFPTITVSGLYDQRNQAGTVTAAFVNYAVSKVKSTCSAGGFPLPPLVLWGFGGPTSQYGPSFTLNLVTPAAYRAPFGVFRTDSDENYSFARTYIGVRQVVDPQALTDLSGGDAALAARLPATRGLSSETVLADVYGRCAFPGVGIVTSNTVVWVDAFGRPFSLYTNTGTAGERTRASVRCGPVASYPGLITGCDVPIDALSGPGGRAFR